MRTEDHKADRLRAIPGLERMSDRDLRKLDAVADECLVPRGEVLTREGLPGKQAFLIIEGEAEVTVRGSVAATVGPGEVIGEMALLENAPRAATVTALTPMRLLVFAPREFSEMTSSHDPVLSVIVRQLSERLRRVQGSR